MCTHMHSYALLNSELIAAILEEEEFLTNWEETVESFDDMGLKEGVLRGIYGHGFVKPSPIQQKGILPVIQGKDTIAQVNFYI
jgi:translation initiation factor 4A